MVAAFAVLAGCTTSGGSAPPTIPVIWRFSANAASAPAPALVAFTFNVGGPPGATLTCQLDFDGNGSIDATVNNCAGTTIVNHSYDTPGSYTASLKVSDGNTTALSTASVSITTGTSEPFNVTILPVGPDPLTAPVQTAFAAAAAKWGQVIARGIPDTTVNDPAGACTTDAPALSTTIDDVLIEAEVHPIDGVNGILGRAGPCAIWSGDNLPRVGVMEFDSADVTNMINNGTLTSVVIHEMGHVLGFGTEWSDGRQLLQGAGTSDPRYVGDRATAEYHALGGVGTVPVENLGGDGTADAHWRESVFGNELMTGFINSGSNPLSKVSVASMADLGYQVSLADADSYSLPPTVPLRAPATLMAPAPTGVMLRPTPVHF
jgi:PKD repeat protein